MGQGRSPLYWIAAGMAAVLLLTTASSMASNGVFERVAGRKASKPQPYKASNSRTGKSTFKARGVKPGTNGRGRITIGNLGKKPMRRVTLTQDKVLRSGIGPALQLQIFDATTKKCLYPRPKLPKARKGKKPPKEPKACVAWQSWTGGAKLRNLPVPSKKGATWRPGEKHSIAIRWRLDASSPNTDQGKVASFRLRWRFSA